VASAPLAAGVRDTHLFWVWFRLKPGCPSELIWLCSALVVK